MIDFSEIYSGFRNLIFRDSLVERVSVERLRICSECEYSSDIIYYHCMKCGCYIEAKVRSMGSECPLGKWGKEVREEL